MATKAKPKNRIFEAVHETATDLHRLEFIDKRKMLKYDALCLEPVPQYQSEQIRALRESLKLSQAVLAAVCSTPACPPCANGKWATSIRAARL